MMSGSPMLGALELASKQTKLAAACGLQLFQRQHLAGTCLNVGARASIQVHAPCSKQPMQQPLNLTLEYS
jgi:hypothetical protein